MSTPTILRVKRRLEENLQNALETTHIKELVPQSDIKTQIVPNVKDIVDKLRKERKELSTKTRYEIVNCSRGLNDGDEGEDLYNLLDLQKSDDTDGGVQYAYDVYTTVRQDFDILSKVDNLLSIEADLIFEGNECDPASGDEGDNDDDYNDENNWRNDYPDSEPSSIDEDMIRAMEKVDVGEEISSDSDERIYENTYEIDMNTQLYGSGYAKYRARILKEHPDLADGQGLILWATDKIIDLTGYKDDNDGEFYFGQEEDTIRFREQYNSLSDEYSPD